MVAGTRRLKELMPPPLASEVFVEIDASAVLLCCLNGYSFSSGPIIFEMEEGPVLNSRNSKGAGVALSMHIS